MKQQIKIRFKLGKCVVTSNALERLNPADISIALIRHSNCDWGNVCEEDWQENNTSVVKGFRLLSAYVDSNGTKFWIITEVDRSVTTILLPEDY